MSEPREEAKLLEKKAPVEKEGQNALQELAAYVRDHKIETLSYAFMFVGVIVFIFNEMVGGLIVGALTGFYFHRSIACVVKKSAALLDGEGLFRAIMFGGFLVCLGIVAPYLVIGLAGSALLMTLVSQADKKGAE